MSVDPTSTRQRSPNWVTFGKSPAQKAVVQQVATGKKSHRVQAARAHHEAVKAMQSRVNSLISTRQTLRRASDEAGREYSSLTYALRDAEATIGTLKTRQMAHEECLVEFAVLSPFAQCSPTKIHELEADGERRLAEAAEYAHGAAGSSRPYGGQPLPSAGTTRQSRRVDPNNNKRSSSNWNRAEIYEKRSASAKATSSEAQRSLGHGVVLQRHIDGITATAASSKSLLGEIAVHARQVRHMMVLVDRATDIEMQCMGQGAFEAGSPSPSLSTTLAPARQQTSSSPSTSMEADVDVLVNASPLYPMLNADDADAVIKACSDVNVKAARATLLLKRAIAAANGEIAESSTSLVNVMKVGAKCAQEKFSQAKRTVAGIAWEEQLLHKRLQKAQAEKATLTQRLALIEKSLKMRSASGLRLDRDEVASSLQQERIALEKRRDDVSKGVADILTGLESVENERRRLQHDVEEASSSSALFLRIARSANVTPAHSIPNTPRV